MLFFPAVSAMKSLVWRRYALALLTGRPGDLNFWSVYTGGVVMWHSVSTPAEPVRKASSLSTLAELGFGEDSMSCGAGVWYVWEAYAG